MARKPNDPPRSHPGSVERGGYGAVRPLNEGKVQKGGQNANPSDGFARRPAPPAAMKPQGNSNPPKRD